jgi:hypothetical protein
VSNFLEHLLKDKDKAGVYLAGPDTRLIAEAAQAAGLALWRVDIGHVHDKQGFTGLVAKALAFPDWFGGNWDAFEDCLSDLSWHPAPGFVLLLEHGKHFGAGHKQEFVTAVEVLDGAAECWREQGKPFWAIVSGPEGWKTDLPAFPLV